MLQHSIILTHIIRVTEKDGSTKWKGKIQVAAVADEESGACSDYGLKYPRLASLLLTFHISSEGEIGGRKRSYLLSLRTNCNHWASRVVASLHRGIWSELSHRR